MFEGQALYHATDQLPIMHLAQTESLDQVVHIVESDRHEVDIQCTRGVGVETLAHACGYKNTCPQVALLGQRSPWTVPHSLVTVFFEVTGSGAF